MGAPLSSGVPGLMWPSQLHRKDIDGAGGARCHHPAKHQQSGDGPMPVQACNGLLFAACLRWHVVAPVLWWAWAQKVLGQVDESSWLVAWAASKCVQCVLSPHWGCSSIAVDTVLPPRSVSTFWINATAWHVRIEDVEQGLMIFDSLCHMPDTQLSAAYDSVVTEVFPSVCHQGRPVSKGHP